MAYYKIKSHAGDGKLLNVSASKPITSRSNVCIWDESCPLDQIWSITTLGNNQEVKVLNNLSYMLNAKRSTTGNWDCDVMTSNSDTKVNFEKVTTNVYYIRLVSDTTKYLTATGTTSGSNINWQTLGKTATAKKAQQWKVTTTALPAIYTRTGGAGHDTLGETQMRTNASHIYRYLTGKGFSKNAICGILGNMEEESTINPAAWQVQDNLSYGYGLCQWDDGSNFTNWAVSKGIISGSTNSAMATSVNSLAYDNPVRLMNAELDYLIGRMGTSDWFKPSNNSSKYGTTETLSAAQFKECTDKDAGVLARIFCGHYERPDDPIMADRVAAAKKWYNYL